MDKIISKCILCGSKVNMVFKHHPGYQDKTYFDIYFCNTCNTSFSSPRDYNTASLYQKIYQYKDKIPGYNRYWKYSQEICAKKKPLSYLASNESIYWGVEQSLKKFNLLKSAKIIEIGSGLGYLTFALNKAGYQTKGIDISRPAVDYAIEKFGEKYICQDVFEFTNKNKESYDVVIINEVIEHVNDPIKLVKVLLDLIKENGKIILTTPNKSLFPKDIFWATENPPIHCWWFSEDSINLIAKSLNAKVTFLDYTKFYKKNYASFSLNYMKKRTIPRPVFTEDGNLLINIDNDNNSFYKKIRKKLFSIILVKNLYNKFLDLNQKNTVICGYRGTSICAIIEKS
jgi:SAM-dependent methyltransferase